MTDKPKPSPKRKPKRQPVIPIKDDLIPIFDPDLSAINRSYQLGRGSDYFTLDTEDW
jgi:hypothetical protein